MQLCEYGCGEEAKHYFPYVKKWCCNDTTNKCANLKKQNSQTKKGLLNPSKKLEVRKKLSIAAKNRLNMFGDTNPAKRPEVRAKLKGKNNHNWKGGISCDPYCIEWLDQDYKNSIKERDGYQCLNPCCNMISKHICIHHINYNKKDCKPRNLITLCYSCNSTANYNREWHKSWYQAIIYRRNY